LLYSSLATRSSSKSSRPSPSSSRCTFLA
jgi:hypothetical protein